MKYSIEYTKSVLPESAQVKSIEFLGAGKHSKAFFTNSELVLKLPKHRTTSNCPKTEMQVLQGLSQSSPLAFPNVLFSGSLSVSKENLVYYVSKRLKGTKLTKQKFLMLDEKTLVQSDELVAEF